MHFFQFYPYSRYIQGFIFIFIPTMLKTCWPYFCLLNTSNSFPLKAFAFLTLAYILPLIICMVNSFLSVLSHPTFNIISSKILWLNISAFFWPGRWHVGSYFPNQESNLCLQWKLGVLISGPPGNFLNISA